MVNGTLGTGATFNANDSITGQVGGNSTLALTDGTVGPADAVPTGVAVTNVQNATLQTVNAVGSTGTPFDVSGWTGLNNFTVTGSTGADFITAAGTTALSVTDTAGPVTVNGGSTVAVTTDTGSAVAVHGLEGSTTAVSVTGGDGITLDETAAGGTATSSLATVAISGNAGADIIVSNALAALALTNDSGGSVTINDNATAAQQLAVSLTNVTGEAMTDDTAGMVLNLTSTGSAANTLGIVTLGDGSTVNIAGAQDLTLTVLMLPLQGPSAKPSTLEALQGC